MSYTSAVREELAQVFRSHEKPKDAFRIGAESEKFAVHEETLAPLGYGGDFSVCRVFTHLETQHGWTPIREVDEGPIVGLRRDQASITLEPSVQFELSGQPHADLHLVNEERQEHLEELASISREMNIAWLETGFHPFSRLEHLPWVPKQRYPIMRAYLPQMGKGALDMMQRTATVQGNFDYANEEDAMRKLGVALRLSPLMQAWFSNAPFCEGGVCGGLSRRGHVWRHMDPSRSGLIRSIWKEQPTYDDYVDWSLDAGMFLFWRDKTRYTNTGQTFRQFIGQGYQGHRATLADYRLHLTTLFPEVRLKNTLEVRSVDAVSPPLALASLAVFTGVLYDERALAEAQSLLRPLSFDEVEAQRPALIDRGLHASLAGESGFVWAEKVLEIARGGLARRQHLDAAGNDETIYLQPAEEIIESRKMPAERALDRFDQTGSILEATRTALPDQT